MAAAMVTMAETDTTEVYQCCKHMCSFSPPFLFNTIRLFLSIFKILADQYETNFCNLCFI